jgi:hypothetical protein
MGPQVLSDKRTNMTTGLGHGDRFNYDFVKRAKEQPGAGDYNVPGACGRQQVLSACDAVSAACFCQALNTSHHHSL